MKKAFLIFIAFILGSLGFGFWVPEVILTGDPVALVCAVGVTLLPIIGIFAYITKPEETNPITSKRRNKNIF